MRRRGLYLGAMGWSAVLLLPMTAALLSEAAPAKPAAKLPQPKALSPTPQKLTYNRDIRPILADNCFACHGPDSAARKAGLRLDSFAEATANRNGRAAMVPGKPQASEMVKRILGDGPLMPPAASHKKLTPVQITTLKRWVTEGGAYEAHWSYIAPKRPAVPAVKNAAWVRNPIDNFVLARLEQAGLTPAPEADRRTLARRLSLDLTGLPPDPKDVEAFVNDRSPDAYEKLVDKFMSSPQWGEHRGRFWLDAARYADTHGIHFDNFREIWAYRDWVIKAFNRNMPFDQFTIEQLAGDLLPNPTLDQIVATGFNRCNITTNEGGVIPEEYAVLYTRDRTETTSLVWLGTTAGCAVCHDHKFDPVSQREFYSLAAYFNNTTQNVMDGNIKDTPPIIPVPLEQDRPRFEALQAEMKSTREQADGRKQAAREDFGKWMSQPNLDAARASIPTDGLQFHAPLNEGQGRALQTTADGKTETFTAAADPGWPAGHVAPKAFQRTAAGVVEFPNAGDFERDKPFTVSAWVRVPRANLGGSILARMDDQSDFRGWDIWLEGGRVGMHLINKWPDDALKGVSRQPLQVNRWHLVTITYTGSGNVDGLRFFIDGQPTPADTQANQLKSTIRTQVPLKLGQRHTTSVVEGVAIQDLRIYNRALPAEQVAQLGQSTRAAYLASRPAEQLNNLEKEELFAWWLNGTDEQYRALSAKVAALETEERNIRARGTIAHVAREKSEEAMAYILFRGEYDRRKDPVKPATPAFLPAMPESLPKNRLGFAKWLLLPEHPLTTRVTVNRFWQEVFGQGIVRSSGDFGVMGELPSHQNLLDWLSVEFREGGWDMKKFFKLMVTSATYRQSAATTPQKNLKDASNRLLSRGPRFRMDAEMIRDYALASSGLLVRKLGGPSVKPYQPPGVWEAVAMIGSNTRDYKRDTGENLYRRSMYTFWKRSAPPASLDIFNAPNRETCVVKRERTNTPLQALVTLNDEQFVEAARHLATHALKDGGATADTQINYMANRLIARPFSAKEMAIVRQSLVDLQTFYRGHAKEAQELISVGESKPDESLPAEQLAAWTMLANQLMNLDEVLNK